jgi:low temperature requirement protein LtrA
VLRHEVADDGRVTWLELFFDLIYVAALIQLGDRLAGDISWSGMLRFGGAFVMLWWTWTGTTVFTNRFAVDDITHRLLSFVQMFAVGNLAIIAATTPSNWTTWLVVAYITARLPLILMYVRVLVGEAKGEKLTLFLVQAFVASLVLFALSLLLPSDVRPVVWAIALLIEFGAPLVATRKATGAPIHEEHFQERYALFTIIVLGETFVKTLTEIGSRGISIETQVFGGLAFVILIAIWWTYFDDVADAHIRSTSALSKTQGGNRLIWTYIHLPLAGAITGFGVAAKKVVGVEAFSDALKENYLWLLIGTLVVLLVAVAILDLVTASPHYAIEAPERVVPRLLAAAALGGVGLLTVLASPAALLSVGLIAAIVVAQIAIEVMAAHKSEYRISREVSAVIAESAGACEHLEEVDPVPIPVNGVCSSCAEAGKEPVQLRWCLTCGFVGCCDDTPGQHARLHHEETGHTMIGTLERGDDWAYCYLHDVSAQNFLSRS